MKKIINLICIITLSITVNAQVEIIDEQLKLITFKKTCLLQTNIYEMKCDMNVQKDKDSLVFDAFNNIDSFIANKKISLYMQILYDTTIYSTEASRRYLFSGINNTIYAEDRIIHPNDEKYSYCKSYYYPYVINPPFYRKDLIQTESYIYEDDSRWGDTKLRVKQKSTMFINGNTESIDIHYFENKKFSIVFISSSNNKIQTIYFYEFLYCNEK